MELLDRIAMLLHEAEIDNWNKSETADAILAIPEIRDAMEVAANLRANQERQRRMFNASGGMASASLTHAPPKNT